MTVENYHLKWDSHLTHLNSAISTLFRNERFADVLLYSSSPEPGVPKIGISAHKFILSSSSQFFATIFDSTLPSSTSNGIFHIVLPPDLTQRTIQILVQYMYSGEATVPNEVLSEVLRGGELLKIRGLCRAPPSSNSELNNCDYSKPNHGEANTRFANELRGLGASVLPEESPVIVKSPKPPHIGLLRVVNSSSLGGRISVNKDVAIDPEPGESNYSYPPEINPRVSCRESGCTGCTEPSDIESPMELAPAPKLTMRTDLHNSQSIEEKSTVPHSQPFRRISLPIDPLSTSEEPLNCCHIKEEPSDSWHAPSIGGDVSPLPVGIPKIVLKLKMPRPAPIKLEAPGSGDEECSQPPLDNIDHLPYTRLACDVCKTSFDEPKAWVRHMESHMEKPEPDKDSDNSSSAFNRSTSKTVYVPKKRRRISPQHLSGDHVTLICDLCTMSFTTPAEWVRHTNTQHTESELALFNNQRNAVQQKPTSEAEVVRYSRRHHHTSGLFKALS
ncbi:uncharacterized protein LOC129911731 isoform X2 [Episyrphus balteatus]|uniref:uncharacterized protein LOC129911731 isoform X2 n=1 Tax=Episyrphus balteatus TaxID=286459 RepID=UPI0024857B8D|nr:uncharacterized protein LOC129911731 isoform X2 [Episyrphus balteatus]